MAALGALGSIAAPLLSVAPYSIANVATTLGGAALGTGALTGLLSGTVPFIADSLFGTSVSSLPMSVLKKVGDFINPFEWFGGGGDQKMTESDVFKAAVDNPAEVSEAISYLPLGVQSAMKTIKPRLFDVMEKHIPVSLDGDVGQSYM